MRSIAMLAVLVAGLFATGASWAGPENEARVVTYGSNYVPGDARFGVPTLILRQGTTLRYTNLDLTQPHSITHWVGPDETPLFDSGLVNNRPIGQAITAEVVGVASLSPGEYPFICSVHGGEMSGALKVV